MFHHTPLHTRILDALLPCTCILCGNEGSILCPSCKEKLNGRQTPKTLHHPTVSLDSLTYCYPFDLPAIQTVIHSMKYQGLWTLAKPLTDMVIGQIPASAEPTVLVPIPLHWRRLVFRGYNQSEMLARALADSKGDTVDTNLSRIRFTRIQARLSADARQRNMRDAFEYHGRDVPSSAILIDDVATTMATLEAAAREMKRCGTLTVTAFVIAHGH